MFKSDKNKTKQEKQQLTTISISKSNYQKLRQLGYATQSMNDVMTNLLNNVYKAKGEED